MRNALLHVVSAVSAVSAVMQGCSNNAYCARPVDRASVSTTPPGNRKDLSAIRSVKKKLDGKLKGRFDQDQMALKKLLCKPQSESVLEFITKPRHFHFQSSYAVHQTEQDTFILQWVIILAPICPAESKSRCQLRSPAQSGRTSRSPSRMRFPA